MIFIRDGESFLTIHDAIEAAKEGDVISVTEHVYLDKPLIVKKNGITIQYNKDIGGSDDSI